MAQLHDLQPQTSRSSKKRVGRGGKRGKTSGKGHKGQKARAGGTPRPEVRDIIKKIPKLRGHGKNRARTVSDARVSYTVVNVGDLERIGTDISPQTLAEAGVIKSKSGKLPPVKILGEGEISKKVTVSGCALSASAKEKIEKAGGTIKE